MPDALHIGDVGAVIELTVTEGGAALDISGATVKQLKLKQLGGTTKTKTAAFKTNGVDGVLAYTTLAGDLADATGKETWYAQAYLELPGWSGHSAAAEFTVSPVL